MPGPSGVCGGDPGTRLAREAVTAAAGPRAASRWAVASAASQTVPLGAFATLTGQELPAGTDGTLLAHAAAVLSDGSAVVGVDDAHPLDMISAALLHQLAAARAVRLVLTVRTGEPTPDAVTALWKDGLLERIELAAFTPAQTDAVLTAALRAPVDAHSVERLFSARFLAAVARALGAVRCSNHTRLSGGEAVLGAQQVRVSADGGREGGVGDDLDQQSAECARGHLPPLARS